MMSAKDRLYRLVDHLSDEQVEILERLALEQLGREPLREPVQEALSATLQRYRKALEELSD